ncbi:MAG TPA: sugar phosphate isomerase/epimerase family protein [Anaerolineales bacterium]|nr:sugar phosphate isomerase/epimerase family protein [Anaerolineales bacterium]
MRSSIPVAVTTGSLYPLPTLPSIRHLNELGIQDIELTLQSNEFLLTFERKLSMPILPELLALVQNSELRVRSVHAPLMDAERCYNLWARLEFLVHSIEVCRLLGGRLVVIHPFHVFRTHEDALAYLDGVCTSLTSALLPGLNDVLDLAHSVGIKLALENIQDWQDEIFFNAPQNVIRFLQDMDHPTLGVTLDLMHAQYPNFLDEFVQALSAEIVNIHAADLLPPVKRVAVGKGVIEWNRLVPMLQTLSNLCQITVELSNPQPDELIESIKLLS